MTVCLCHNESKYQSFKNIATFVVKETNPYPLARVGAHCRNIRCQSIEAGHITSDAKN